MRAPLYGAEVRENEGGDEVGERKESKKRSASRF
jgi:hypothetical protein